MEPRVSTLNTSLMTRTESDDQLDVLLWLNQEFDHYNMQYFNQFFCKHFRPSVSVNGYRKDYVT